jgi:hypothetical protein
MGGEMGWEMGWERGEETDLDFLPFVVESVFDRNTDPVLIEVIFDLRLNRLF